MSDVHQQDPHSQQPASIKGQLPPDRIDPDAKVPSAVRAQAQAIEDYYRQAVEPPETPVTPPDNASERQNRGENSEVSTPEAVPPAPAPVQSQEIPPAPPQNTQEGQSVPPKPDEQSWEHRYNSMKGRFDRSQQRISHLEGLLASIQPTIPQQNTQQNQPNNPDLTFERLVTPEEEETYGKEFLSVVAKRAQEAFAPTQRQLERKIQELEGQLQGVGTTVSRDAKSKMYETLDREVSNWKEMDTDPDFIEWLKLPDVLSGEVRYNLLQRALAAYDAQRVLAFFKGFLAEEAALAPASAVPTPPPAPAQPRTDLRQFAAPGRAKSAAVTPPAEKPVYTAAQIASYYAALNRGDYRGREAEWQRLERDIFSAQSEGRVR
jgi:hypothetical protein